ncbi:hypothetical protein [Flavilitoribacter nigricans]|uniref:Macroglobulin domain-containing protein n=1 Tax=Flavilitoribacter nigricans (strain ATCC 23147 / DSM 23189 / NBRC 102662 / NCIMB 1420 / SS-2) TaxID=1122177 RepID=A0A2D0N584_FLAN2|nr:hypothetical protein [Flavilitoribacter nigricans]PHN03546.1 hypothetical protein CRP01_26470 [Flavilitoribacter nigricans DSM 23189 = NBRC 102662]
MQIFRSLVCLVLMVLPLAIRAQTTGTEVPAELVAERLLVHTDRQLYISGEVIWFRLLAFAADTDQLSDFSQVAYVELISPDRIPVSRVKIDLNAGQGNGSIELPQALNSGSYVLRAYTQAMRNGAETDFARSKLIILNPGQAVVRADAARAGDYAGFVPEHPTLTVDPARSLNIQIETVQATVGQRSEAVLEITTTDAAGRPVSADLSLAVALQATENTGTVPLFQEGSRPAGRPAVAPGSIRYAPEDRGMNLSGKVIDEVTQSGAADADIFLAFPGDVARVYMARTDEAGNFSFLLPELYGLRQVVLQTHPEETRNLRMELTDEFHPIAAKDQTTFILPPDWVPVANAALVNAQVRQSYQSFELPPVYEVGNHFDSIPFFGQPEALYRLDDYNRFPLPEFFFEIVLEVAVKGKYGSERVEVINEWESPFEDPKPLLLVDGVPVFDQRTFLKINNKLIETAEIVTEPFWLNPLFYNGVIQLISFEKDGRCFRLPENALQRSFLTLLPERQFSVPDYAAQPDSRLPDFRNTLYWDPSVHTDEQGKATVRFFTGDAVGNFEIRLEGVSPEGHLGSSAGSLEVVKEVR